MLLCVVALALRLLMPAGWMPVAGPHGITLALCNAQSDPLAAQQARALLAEAFPDAPDDEHDADDMPCAFAAVAHAAIAPFESATALIQPIPTTLPFIAILDISPGRGLAAPPPPPTGPPLLA